MNKFNEKRTQNGFTLLSLLVAITVAGILWMIAQPTFNNNTIDCKHPDQRLGYIMRAKVANTVAALGAVNLKLQRFELSHNRYPEDGELDLGNDPWGNAYVFTSFKDMNGNGPKRKFKSAVPVNMYYDVYSIGPDGQTATPMVSEPGGDDIIIANNGLYIGIACHYGN